ncbi:SDR family NAD(P)-dependent oxidoreductase [Floccifex sp.]|uniref:SDR family NAD(P)-dependent oxidoreductase n=1 Tax=Floccifex sp. TaxID=2815810 RepID=UPI003EFC711F
MYTLADICKEEDIHKGVLETMKKFERIDVAIQNACLCTFDSEEESDLSIYQKVMDINYFGCLRLCKEVLPMMKKQNKGKIIFTSSGVGVTGFGNISPYASSKGAIESLAKCLAIENQDKNISFHLFHPPLTKTNSSNGLKVPKEFMASAEKVGMGLAKNIDSNKFVICHSLSQSIQMKLCYRHPLYMGKMMWNMTNRKKENI